MMIVHVLVGIVLPVFVIMGIGAALDRIFHLDAATLSKLNFYVLVPALCFVKIVETRFSGGELLMIAGFTLAHMAVMFFVALAASRAHALRAHTTVLTQSAVFSNCGNFGIPFIALAVGADAVSVMALVIVIQNFVQFTFGTWQFERGRGGTAKLLSRLLKVPVVHAVVLGWLIHVLSAKLGSGPPEPVMVPLRYLADGLIPVALLTLGVELSRSRIGEHFASISSSVVLRLVVSPIVAIAMVTVLSISGPLSRILVYAGGFPVAVNVFILASEYGKDKELASQAVFWSTLISAVTLVPLVVLYR